VQAFPSSHETPADTKSYEQTPAVQVPVARKQLPGAVLQTMPAQGSPLHTPVAASHPVGQFVSWDR
jgi:hypothetical protein